MRALRLALYWLAWRVLDPLGIPVFQPKEKTVKNCTALLQSVREELHRIGLGTDAEVNGADAVEYLGKLLPDVEEALERDGIPLQPIPAEACTDPDDYDDAHFDSRWDEDMVADDPRHGQAEGINRENRGRS